MENYEKRTLAAIPAFVFLLVSGLVWQGAAWCEESRREELQKPDSTASWDGGFRIEHQDPNSGREYRFRFRTGIQPRFTYVITDKKTKGYNLESSKTRPGNGEDFRSFIMRRLRFFVDGSAPNADWSYYVHVQLEPQSGVNAHDAVIEWRRWREFRIQFGRMKIPAFGMEFWQSGFMQNGTDRTIFTGDSENDTDLFGGSTYDFPSGNARLRVGSHLLKNGFSPGGFTLYRSQGINFNGSVDIFNKKQLLAYWLGAYNGRDSKAMSTTGANMLYCLRLGFNFLSGSDPKGPLGSLGFYNYFMQGDYGYNTIPLGAFIISSFWQHQKAALYFVPDGSTEGFMSSISKLHRIENYGLSGSLLFRWHGFSADLEYAWEEYIQDETELKGFGEQVWNRSAMRANLGYFLVPHQWELTLKYALVNRLEGNDLEKSLTSGLGLINRNGGWVVEDDLSQYMVGLNYYWDGFNRYITVDAAWMRSDFKPVGLGEAQSVLGIDESSAQNLFPNSADIQNDIRFRIMYQYIY